MTVNLYALNNAVTQGNARTREVEAHNEEVAVFNNELGSRIATAKKETTESEAARGAEDAIKEAIGTSSLISKTTSYLAAKAGQAKAVGGAVQDAVNQAKAKSDELSAGNAQEESEPTTETSEPIPAGEEGEEATGLLEAGFKKAGASAATASKLSAGIGILGDAYTLGSDVEADLNGQFSKMNWEQQVGNIGGIAGSALDIVGTAIPALGVLSVIGTGISALSGAVGAVGDERATSEAGQEEEQQLQSQKQTVQQVQSNAGKAPIALS
tara:strand:+ start:21 stop:827 length:807 start_codon:yes stop_codon:yes gene_type:complete